MAKLSRTELRDAVLEDKSLSEEVKRQLLDLIKTPTFGLVWEEKTEDVIENLRTELPVLTEVKDHAIISEDPQAPNHVLIEADNLEALVALTYTHAEKFDAIYIDPPYNSGATDWRYNNDYVDRDDAYRHSKWLCMIEHRLRIAKRLLKPENSVLIVTIDEKEYHHLGCLLEQVFPLGRIQMISSVINVKGVAREKEFSRVNEYIYIVQLGDSKVEALPLGEEWLGNVKSSGRDKVRLGGMLRTGSNSERSHSPGCFYPIYFTPEGKFVKTGSPIPLSQDRKTVPEENGLIAIWPIHKNGNEGVWQYGRESFERLLKDGFVYFGKMVNGRIGISYAPKGVQAKIKAGLFKLGGVNSDGSLIIDDSDYSSTFIPGNQWSIPSHNATEYGSKLLKEMFGDKVFSYPKSLYAVEDVLRFFVTNKTNAKILDFFAGSGTTLHATMRLNDEDGGTRQCVIITNNENHICEEVTYERNKMAILGYRKKTTGEQVAGLTSNNLRYYRVTHTLRKHTHENKMLLAHAMTEMLQIKWNAYSEPERFGSLRVKPKYMRYFEGDENVLIIYVPEIIPYIVKEIKAMPEGKKLHVYIAADGKYAYSEEFAEVIKRIELASIPSAYYNAIKSILPPPAEETSEYMPSDDDEEIIAQADKNDFQD